MYLHQHFERAHSGFNNNKEWRNIHSRCKSTRWCLLRSYCCVQVIFFCPKLPPSKVLVNYRANSNLHSESSAVIYWTLSNNSLIQGTWMFRLRIMTQPWTTFILLTIHYKLDGSIIDRELLGLIKTYVLLNVKRVAWRECLGSPTLLFIDNFSWTPVRDIIRCWIVCKVRIFQGQNWPSTEATTGYLKLLIDCSPLRITGFTNYLRFSRFHVWKC